MMAMVWAWLAIGVALGASGLASAARAGETVYTRGARLADLPRDPSNWLDAANWSAGVPGPGDTATFEKLDVEIYGGFVPAGTILSGLNVSTGVVLIGGSITVTGGASWTGGEIQSAVTVASGVTLNITGDENKRLSNGGTLQNSGTILWSGTGALRANGFRFGGGSTIINSGLFEARSDTIMGSPGNGTGAPLFINNGTFRKTTGSGVTQLDVEVRNRGAIISARGIINFTQAFSQTAGSLNLAGCRFSASNPLATVGGSLSGSGVFTGPFSNGATISPGSGILPGLFTFR